MDPELNETASELRSMASSADAEHLKLLAIFHFVYAGLIALGGCCVSVYFVLGVMMATGQMKEIDIPKDAMLVGRDMASVTAFAVVFIMMSVFVAAAGRKLLHRRSRTYCMVIAGLMCLNIPVGTALGVFTLYVLVRPSVKSLFDRQSDIRGLSDMPRRRTPSGGHIEPDDPQPGD